MSDDETITRDDEAEAARRLEPYLDTRAGRIPTGPADLDRVVARAGQRRRRRRSAAAVGTAAVLAVGVIGVVQVTGSDRPTLVDSAAPPDTAAPAPPLGAPLAWHPVSPRSGLLHSSATASAGGARFALSTAPGVAEGDYEFPGSTLYRSTDGVEWAAVTTPSGFRALSVGATDDQLYAVGTVPAGGSKEVSVLAASTAGDVTGTVDLPLDVAAIERQVGAPVSISTTSVAAGHGRVAIAVNAHINLWDLRDRLPTVDLSGSATITEDGITVRTYPEDAIRTKEAAEEQRRAAAGAHPATAAPDPAGVPGTTWAADPVATGPVPPTVPPTPAATAPPAPATVTSYPWAQLGLPDLTRQLLLGKPYLFTANATGGFDPLTGPPDVRGRARVLSTADGFRLIVSTASSSGGTTHIFRSSDLVSWQGSGVLAGLGSEAAVVGDRLVVVTNTDVGGAAPDVHTEAPDGTWTALDLGAYTSGPVSMWSEVSVGPLGVAGIWWDEHDRSHVVHSFDGRAATVTDVPTTIDGVRVRAQSVLVGPDAVTVALVTPAVDGPQTPPSLKLLVGVRP